MIRPIHPFPARMAPDLAVAELGTLAPGSVVLDPMAGSGTVLRHASGLGHRAIGFDMDPLAVLMARVWTTPVDDDLVGRMADKVMTAASRGREAALPWIDGDEATLRFVEYWFAEPQRLALRALAAALSVLGRECRGLPDRAAADVLKVAFSRIIVTKDQGASLGRDVSHSRPHKVAETSDFDVPTAFGRSVRHLRKLLADAPPRPGTSVDVGDARHLHAMANASVDAVLTSPPYLNAIDYMRGHRLSLVWLGHGLSELRGIRSRSIGSERGPDGAWDSRLFDDVQDAMCAQPDLSSRHRSMVSRYAQDAYRLMSEVARVLRPGGRAILVVGNSCLKGTFIRNSDGVARAGTLVGLRVAGSTERELPDSRRYLPMPTEAGAGLGKRMRTETILSFAA